MTTKAEFLSQAKHVHETAEKAVAKGDHSSAKQWMDKAAEYRKLASQAQDSNQMFTVDIEFKDGRRSAPQFLTKPEAVNYAGRMAQDSAVGRCEVRGMDARFDIVLRTDSGRKTITIEALSDDDARHKAVELMKEHKASSIIGVRPA